MERKERKFKNSNILFVEISNKMLLYIKKRIHYFEIKHLPHIAFNIKEKRELKNNDNKFQEKGEKNAKNNIIKNFIINKNFVLMTIIKTLILANIFSCSKNNKSIFYSLQYLSNISLKIKGIGENRILGYEAGKGNSLINYLKDVYINGNKQDTISNKYYFNETDNYVELIFEDNINNCYNMFSECSSITEIDFSNFDTSLVISMSSMFENCLSLTSLDLSNFNTSLVTEMNCMFWNCLSLTSLNLSNFNTSLVIDMNCKFFN